MKKLTLSGIIAASVLMMTACSEDNSLQQVPGEGGNVTFTISLPSQMGSRSFADGYSATKLEYAVYDAANDSYVTKGNATFESTSLETTVSLTLANGKEYKIAFFAHRDGDMYTFNAEAATPNVAVDYSKVGEYNSEDNDCFYKLHETGKVTGPVSQSVILTRPVAQINWGTSDLDEPVVTATNNYGAAAANLQTKVDIKGVCTTLNLLTGDATGNGNITLSYKPRPDATKESFPVEPAKYEYLSMNYILVPAESSIVEATLTPNNGAQDNTPVVVANLPVQANYRTNIYGALLTSPAEFTVTKDPNWAGPDYAAEYDAEDYRIANTVSEVNSLFAAGEPKVAIDGAKVTPGSRADANPANISLNKAVKAQALKILGVSAAPVKVAYAELGQGATEATGREFRLVVTGTLSAAEFDLPDAGVKLEGRQNEKGEKASVPTVTITNAASAAVTGEVAVENIAKGDNVTADVEFAGAVELTTTDADSFYSALADEAVDKINVPSTANIDIKDKAIISVSRNLTISLEGTVNTCREQIGVTGSGNVLTVTGSGTVTSKGVQDAKGNRPLNSYDGATLVVRNITVETEQNNGGSSIFSQNGNIELEKVTINSHNFAIGANGGALKVKDCVINSDSNNREGAFSYTLSVASGCKAVIENTQVTGIQGAVTVQGEGSECIIKSGTYRTVNHEQYGEIAFYAVYVTDKGVAIIEGGDFSSPTDRSPNKIAEGNSALVAGDNDVDMPDGNFIIKGGRFSGKAYNHVKNALCELPDGYEYRALTDAGDYKWEVVKK